MYTQRIDYGMKEEYFGLSTDTKPTAADNGDLLTEIDTGKKFRFDQENGVWHEQPADGGSSGGSDESDDPYPGYDLVIRVMDDFSDDVSDYEVLKGDFAAIADKIGAGAAVTGVLIRPYIYAEQDVPTNIEIIPLLDAAYVIQDDAGYFYFQRTYTNLSNNKITKIWARRISISLSRSGMLSVTSEYGDVFL